MMMGYPTPSLLWRVAKGLWSVVRWLPRPRLPRRVHCRVFGHTRPPLNVRWWAVETNWRGDHTGFSFCKECGEPKYFPLSEDEHQALKS